MKPLEIRYSLTYYTDFLLLCTSEGYIPLDRNPLDRNSMDRKWYKVTEKLSKISLKRTANPNWLLQQCSKLHASSINIILLADDSFSFGLMGFGVLDAPSSENQGCRNGTRVRGAFALKIKAFVSKTENFDNKLAYFSKGKGCTRRSGALVRNVFLYCKKVIILSFYTGESEKVSICWISRTIVRQNIACHGFEELDRYSNMLIYCNCLFSRK